LTQDIFSRSHAAQRAKAERAERETLSSTANQEIRARVKADQARREALARPDKPYKPNFQYVPR